MSAAPTGRIFVIGDIHGCPDELDALLRAVRPVADDTLCFLGDYVDRGPASRDVIERLIELEHGAAACVFLRGNHEDMLLSFLGREGRFGDAYLDNGGATTLRSYGIAPRRDPEAVELFPPEHLAFLDRLEMHHDLGRSLCVHAGVRPSVSLARQSAEDLLWIREDFFAAPHDFERVVLYGHTPRREIEIAMPYRIGLDTGLVYGGALSCLELREARLWQVQRYSSRVSQEPIRNRLGDIVLA